MKPYPPIVEIERIERITHEDFYRAFIQPKKPVVIARMATDWPAAQKWSLEFFGALDAPVYLEEGNVMQDTSRFCQASFQEYIQRLSRQSDGEDSKEYLSMLDIVATFPQLQDDIDFSLLSAHKFHNTVLGWIGPAGTVTGFHYDLSDNLYAQIAGQKSFQLVSPDDSVYMYQSPKFDYASRLSQIDATQYDPHRFPLFTKARVQKTILNPGELLFIPRGWWHQVESLSVSISANNFGKTYADILFGRIPDKVRAVLHRYGLYARECTCHMWVDGKRIAKPKEAA